MRCGRAELIAGLLQALTARSVGATAGCDRLLATRRGTSAVAAEARGESGVLVTMVGGWVTTAPFVEVVGIQKPINPELFTLAKMLRL